MAHSSAWRVSDAVAFEAMRDLSAKLIARLWENGRGEGATTSVAQGEAIKIRADALGVDGFDRKSVDALAARFSDRLRDLEDAS